VGISRICDKLNERMAKKIIWSKRVKSQIKTILDYWMNRNKSADYSEKLLNKIDIALSLIAINPILGKDTNIKNLKKVFVRDYFVFYREKEETLVVASIIDARSNPTN
jgi:plasmid stabilization system protein ParE